MLKTQNLIIQTILWILYVCFPIFVLPEPSQILLNDNVVLLGYLISSFISIFFFYYNYYWAIPNLYFTKKYILFAVSVLSFLVSAVVIIKFASYVYISNNELHFVDNPRFSGSFILRFTLIFIISSSLRFFKKMKEIETERAKTELSFLKAQINPHFLFNVLNNIDTLIHTNPNQASESIIKLSDILRYVTYESQNDFVSISHEVDYLNNFIKLSTLRFGENYIKFDCDIQNSERQIAPMLFIPLVENAIKHGDKKSKNGIEISLKVDENIEFTVKNSIAKTISQTDKVGGIGITNLKRRLELIYPENYDFSLIINSETFTAKLWIK